MYVHMSIDLILALVKLNCDTKNELITIGRNQCAVYINCIFWSILISSWLGLKMHDLKQLRRKIAIIGIFF